MAKATAHPNRNLISSEDVEGTGVYDAAGKSIGEIDHLMIDKMSGRIAYAVRASVDLWGWHTATIRCRGRPELRDLAWWLPHKYL